MDDSHSGASGFLDILSSAQAAGEFTSADVVDFQFEAGTNFHSPFSGFAPTVVPISTVDAGFTSSTGLVYGYNAFAAVTVDINSSYDVVGGESFTVFGDVSPFPNSGSGHWVISGASAVPEPSSLILAALSLISMAGSSAWKRGPARKTHGI